MKNFVSIRRMAGIGLGVAFGVLGVTAYDKGLPEAQAQGNQTYQVTVTNLNRGQPLAPSIVVPHDSSFQLFTPGAPSPRGNNCCGLTGPVSCSSPGAFVGGGLAYLAEIGLPACLAAELLSVPGVDGAGIQIGGSPDSSPFPNVIASATIDPLVILLHGPALGLTRTFRITTAATHVTWAAMYGLTNDTFGAITLPLPKGGETVTGYANAWNAGSENNDEQRGHLGLLPPWGSNVPHDGGPGDGYVTISNGFRDGALDWRNPGVLVTIIRVHP
jgi:hypothetical protein